jgi:phage tail sheath protein FI
MSLLGSSPSGVELLSDVTTSLDEAYTSASVNRLTSIWLRALRRAGEEFLFKPSMEETWEELRARVHHIGLSLLAEGALLGESPAAAFSVRCDRSTMSNADIDAGRLRADVEFSPRFPITSIRVAMMLDESQRISVAGGQGAGA